MFCGFFIEVVFINTIMYQTANVFLNIWNNAWPILVAILVFCVIIFIHELGHFLFAKLLGVKVNEFALGFGPAIFKFQKGETKYALRLLPLGGFCAMEGEDEDSKDPRAFNNKPVWRRFIIIVAGAVFNIILGFIIMTLVLVPQQNILNTTVGGFTETAVSAQSGLKKGDKILGIEGKRVFTADDISFLLLRDEDGVVEMKVERDGEKIVLPDVAFKMTPGPDGKNYIELDFGVERVEKTFFTVLGQGVMRTVSLARLIWTTVFDMLSGRYGLNELSGPIGVAQVLSQAATVSFTSLMYLMCFITVNLGVFNLLPLPALDGGRLVFLIIEGIRRKPVPPKYEGYVHAAGFVLLMILMVVVAGNDILKLIRGG